MVVLKKRLSDQIYEAIKQDILNQNIGFGEKVTNRQIQERYGVSSTPIRDAINRLYLDGFLDEISNSGARIIPFDYKIAIEVNEVISMLNREALALSARHAAEVVPLLKDILNQQMLHIGEDLYFDFDRQFHQTFFDFCGNSRIIQLHSRHRALWLLLIRFYYADREMRREKAFSQHRQIYESYQSADIFQAQRHMEEHFHEALRPIKHVLGQSG
jgi:DNA-binding GntR family transcriptional regulator